MAQGAQLGTFVMTYRGGMAEGRDVQEECIHHQLIGHEFEQIPGDGEG